MKNFYLLTVLCTLFSYSAISQDFQTPPTSAPVADDAISKGNWIVGGAIGSTSFNFSTDTYNLQIDPKAGYFFGENLALGAELLLGLTAYDGGTNFNYGIAPFARYYYTQGGGPTGRIFQEVAVGIAGSSFDDSDDEPVSLLIGIRGGYAHFVARNIAVEAILGYTYTKADIDASTGGGGLELSLGFQIYIPGRGNR